METVKGFLLGVSRFSESSAVVSIFSDKYGRFTGIAKGAYRKGSSFAAALEPFALCEFTLSMRKNREMQTLSGCTIIDYYVKIRSDIDKIAAAESAIEVIRLTVHEQEPLPQLYRLLEAFLIRLNSPVNYNHDWILRMTWLFLLHFFKVMGFGPVLSGCARCGVVSQSGRVVLSPLHGGILCPTCGLGIPNAKWILSETAQKIYHLYESRAENLESFPDIEKKLMDDLLTEFMKVHFEKDIRLASLAML